MREILFRGKAKANDEGINFDGWVYGSLLIRRCGEYEICGRNNRISFVMPVIPETVGQFTGLYDKNGNKVFEGDIIEIYEDGGETAKGNRAVIEYGHYNCGCCHCVYGFASSNENDYHQALRFLFEKPPTSEDLEACRVCGDDVSVIIGNIHDNPELVKEETK